MKSVKPYIFFLLIFILVIYLYFNMGYIEMFRNYFSVLLLICGIIGVFLYPIANKIPDQESFEDIKSLVIERFRKKNKN
jgi:hypothetical protein